MNSIHPHLILIVLSTASHHFGSVGSQGEEAPPASGMCILEYLEQPPDQLTCNPYGNMELKLECTISLVTGESLSGRPTVDWFHSPIVLQDNSVVWSENRLAISRLDSSQANITIREQMLSHGSILRVRSRLEVSSLDAADVGQYWCGIRIDSMDWMTLSDPVILKPPRDYAGLDPCSTNLAQSKEEKKCAMWSLEPPPPLYRPTTPSLSTTTTDFNTATASDFTTDDNLATTSTTMESESEEDEDENDGGPRIMEFYIAVGILVAFATVITALILLVIRMCIKYKKMVRGKQTVESIEEKSPPVITQSLSTTATDYLVPLSMSEQRQVPVRGDTPMYLSEYRQDFTAFWLQQHQQRSSEALEHSYETMNHDYEDIFLESLNGNPVVMKSNEAYTIPRSWTNSCHTHAVQGL